MITFFLHPGHLFCHINIKTLKEHKDYANIERTNFNLERYSLRVSTRCKYLLHNVHVIELHCNKYCVSVLIKLAVKRQCCFQQCHVLWFRNVCHTAECKQYKHHTHTDNFTSCTTTHNTSIMCRALRHNTVRKVYDVTYTSAASKIKK